MKTFSISILLALVVSISNAQLGDIFKPSLKVSLLGAPEKNLDEIQRIAVLDFENVSSVEYKKAGADIGSKMADYLVSSLLQDYRGKSGKCYIEGARTDIYSIIERAELQKVIEEQKLGISGILNEADAVELGQILGVDAVILGNVSYTSTDERDKSSYKNKEGKTITTYSLKRTCSAEVRMKLLSIKTGEVIGQTNSRSQKYDSSSGSQPPNISSVSSAQKLAEHACESLSNTLANYFTPYYYTYSFTFENVKNKELKERAKDAKEFMKLGEIDKAYQMYDAIYQVDEYNPELLYNMGVLHEVVGDYKRAEKLYTSAVNMQPDRKMYVDGLNRSKQNMILTERLAAMGINIEPHKFPNASETERNLLAEKVKVKGTKGKRKPVYINSSESAKIIAQIPGGMKFDVLGRSEDQAWILIELPSGERGYFFFKDVIEGQ
ncbi:MAG: CsgG/HfaB family protein [Bacteroidota bacterium]